MNSISIPIFRTIIALIGSDYFLSELDYFIKEGDNEKIIELMLTFVEYLEERKSKRIFDFQDKTSRKLSRSYIITYRGSETIEGEPVIIINDFPIGLKGEKNPVIDLELIYDDIEVRDKDIEKLNIVLN